MIKYRMTTAADTETFVQMRLETLIEMGGLSDVHRFDAAFVGATREYFEHGDHATIFAVDGENVVGCATLSFIETLPSLSHPTGRRSHLFGVYVKQNYRRQGIAQQMMKMLIGEAKNRGVTEITLDTTDDGRPLYEKLGFKTSDEYMELELELN